MLKDLVSSCHSSVPGRFELQDSLESILKVIKSVNDSLHQVNIVGLPPILHPLGSLVCQETFSVVTENKSQSQILFRNRAQQRHVLLYEKYLIFCKLSDCETGGEAGPTQPRYQFKFSLGLANISVNRIKGEERKLEVWSPGQGDVYVLEASDDTKLADFARELLVWAGAGRVRYRRGTEVEGTPLQSDGEQRSSQTGSDCLCPGSDSVRSRRSQFGRSSSLEVRGTNKAAVRSRSLDTEESEEREEEDKLPVYKVLADYTALSSREVGLEEGEVVRLVKVGCAGWWFVRKGDSQGWAPSTYLQLLPEITKTLGRK